MSSIPVMSEQQLFDAILNKSVKGRETFYAFYSSWWGGIVKNPSFMMVPIDDHLVHRGDGVFEAIKVASRSVYLLDAHLKRLFSSAEKISLKIPFSLDDIKKLILETLRVADQSEAIIRLYVSRGPGNFSVNPYDTLGSQLYIVITELKPPALEKYEQGVSIGISAIEAKSAFFSQIKSCNYLPNVLMKKEAIDRSLDFVVGMDAQGNITEGPTENILIVDSENTIVHPSFHTILRGTILVRACELARQNGFTVKEGPISVEDLKSAREVMLAGTTLNVLPVVKVEGHQIASGRPGKVATLLNELIMRDIESGSEGVSF